MEGKGRGGGVGGGREMEKGEEEGNLGAEEHFECLEVGEKFEGLRTGISLHLTDCGFYVIYIPGMISCSSSKISF